MINLVKEREVFWQVVCHVSPKFGSFAPSMDLSSDKMKSFYDAQAMADEIREELSANHCVEFVYGSDVLSFDLGSCSISVEIVQS